MEVLTVSNLSWDAVLLCDFLCSSCGESWTCILTGRFNHLSCVGASSRKSRKSCNTSRRGVFKGQITVDSRQISRQDHLRCRSLGFVAKIPSPHALRYDLKHANYILYVNQAAMSMRKHRLHDARVQRRNTHPRALRDTCNPIPGTRRSHQWVFNLFDTERFVDTHAHMRFLR